MRECGELFLLNVLEKETLALFPPRIRFFWSTKTPTAGTTEMKELHQCWAYDKHLSEKSVRNAARAQLASFKFERIAHRAPKHLSNSQ